MDVFQVLLAECEADIRDGRAQSVGKRLVAINIAKVPRAYRLPLANVCRRAHLLSLGLKILSPAVRSKSGEAPGARELAEYSVLLSRYGAVGEALRILEKVDLVAAPEAHLYRAFCYFNQWDYGSALPSLNAYIATDLTPYARLIAQVNLASCLVALRSFDDALELLQKTIAQARAGKYLRLLGNCYELRAQVYLQLEKTSPALKDLERASQLFGEEKTFDELFVRKWRAVLASRAQGSPDALLRFRQDAIERQEPESVRETDFYLLKLQFDQKLFDHLLFGTPFQSYRQRLVSNFPEFEPKRELFLGDAKTSWLDLETGEGHGVDSLKPGSKPLALINALLTDFYKPLSLGALFDILFPGEHFDVFSSPHRVHQMFFRTREWLEQAAIPVAIVNDGNHYELKLNGPFAFRLPLTRTSTDKNEIYLQKLRHHQSQSSWDLTSSEARTLLGLSPESFKRFAQWAVQLGLMQRSGQGRATKYRAA